MSTSEKNEWGERGGGRGEEKFPLGMSANRVMCIRSFSFSCSGPVLGQHRDLLLFGACTT